MVANPCEASTAVRGSEGPPKLLGMSAVMQGRGETSRQSAGLWQNASAPKVKDSS
jgi:hypothetical protein